MLLPLGQVVKVVCLSVYEMWIDVKSKINARKFNFEYSYMWYWQNLGSTEIALKDAISHGRFIFEMCNILHMQIIISNEICSVSDHTVSHNHCSDIVSSGDLSSIFIAQNTHL